MNQIKTTQPNSPADDQLDPELGRAITDQHDQELHIDDLKSLQ